jgi:hypothetical protein
MLNVNDIFEHTVCYKNTPARFGRVWVTRAATALSTKLRMDTKQPEEH